MLLFDAAGGAALPNDINNAKLRVTVMVTGADGYQVALGWGEIDPDVGGAPILLAYQENGQPMGDKEGAWPAWSCPATSVSVGTSRR